MKSFWLRNGIGKGRLLLSHNSRMSITINQYNVPKKSSFKPPTCSIALLRSSLNFPLNKRMSTIAHLNVVKEWSYKSPKASSCLRPGLNITLNRRMKSTKTYQNERISTPPRDKVTQALRKFKEKEEKEKKRTRVEVKLEKDIKMETKGENQKPNEVKLFSSEEVYLKTMPWRDEHDLLDNPWYVEKSDLENCLKSIKKKENKRKSVYYLCSPSNSGKSAAVLNIFANYNSAIYNVSPGRHLPPLFDLFLYLPFANNNGNSFKKLIKTWEKTEKEASDHNLSLEDIGGFYMHRCLQVLLEEGEIKDAEFEFTSVKKLLKETKSKDPIGMITNLLKKHNLEKVKFLVNVDEHRKISDNKKIRRGAMLALAAQPNFTVIATFTKPLADIPSQESSEICRFPVQLIPLSQKTVLLDKYHLKLKDISSNLNKLNSDKKTIFLSLAGRILSHLALLKNLERSWTGFIEPGRTEKATNKLERAEKATNDVLEFLSNLINLSSSGKALSSLKDDEKYPNLKELRYFVSDNIPAEIVTKTDYVDFLSLTSELSVDKKMENTNLTLLTFTENKSYFCQPLFNVLRTRPSSTDMVDLWVGCKQLFVEEVLKKKFFNNSFLEYGYAWNLCFSKKLIEMYTKKNSPYIKDLKRADLMLKKGVNKDLLKNLEAGVFYVPQSSNHPGCDLFCVLMINNEKVLICIEIKSGKSGLTGFQMNDFPKTLADAIEEVKNESEEKADDKVKHIDRVEFLVIRPGVERMSGYEESPFPWKEEVGCSASELLGPFVQLIPSIIEAEDLFKEIK